MNREDNDKGITFQEFRVFGQFLNNLEDFMIAMRMYTLADHPISKGMLSFKLLYFDNKAKLRKINLIVLWQ